jgi:predicted secreted protein
MVAQKGKDLLLKLDSTGSGSFVDGRRLADQADRLQQPDG